MNPLSLLDNDWWAGLNRGVSAGFASLVEKVHDKADRIRLGQVRGGDALQWTLLNVCLSLPFVIFESYRFRVLRVICAVFDLDASQYVDTPGAIYVPNLYPVAHAVFLISIIVPRSKLPVVVIPGVAAAGVALGLFDVLSLLLLALFVSGVYLITKGGWATRPWKLVMVVIAYILFMNACQSLPNLTVFSDVGQWLARPEPNIVGMSRFAPGFIPLLWYACYEACAGRLSFATCQAYFFCRLLMSPVFPVKDLRLDWPQRRQWQWRGIFALGMMFVALVAREHLRLYHDTTAQTWQAASGAKLLLLSYLYYLYGCCSLIVFFNLFIGWARLFGLPIRSAFDFWLIARTPNERWRRWNLLFREWIITYVFYPMMRAKKGLFVSIMVTLLMSGVIHLLGSLTPERFDLMRIVRVLSYWAINGLAIYVVVMVPRMWPDLIDRLKMRSSVLWSIVGIVATSSLYSILYVLRDECSTWADMADYLRQLMQGWRPF